jgi:hypothetical protein
MPLPRAGCQMMGPFSSLGDHAPTGGYGIE